MQKTINNIHKLTVYQYKSDIIFGSPDDSFSLDINSKNLESDFLDSISNFNIDTIELIFFSSIPSIVPSKLFDDKLQNKYLETIASLGAVSDCLQVFNGVSCITYACVHELFGDPLCKA